MSWRSIAGSPLDIATPPPPPIPFNAERGLQHAPSSLSFGFGCGTTLNSSPSHAFESVPGPSSHRLGDQPLHVRVSAPKRRRSSTDQEEDTVESAEVDDDMEILSSPTLTKRRRASHSRSMDEVRGRAAQGTRNTQGIEVGKLLASLDKPALLSLLHSLMQQNQELADQIHTLLPTPSLESIEHALDAAEHKIQAALPVTTANPSVPIREEYVWSRVRTPLAELASEIASYASLFQLPKSSQGNMHPATAFTFLLMTTLRMIRILRLLPHESTSPHNTQFAESLSRKLSEHRMDQLFERLLPDGGKITRNTVVHTILPALLRDWDTWLRTVDYSVNQQGRIYGQDAVISWQRGLASAGIASSTLGSSRSEEEYALRCVMDGAALHMYSTIGWLTGSSHRSPWVPNVSHSMDEVATESRT
ncbi:hypothetical protein MYAM1_002635 [Malassezia yamatoensis]|uniref:Tethering factor for nuclear proteasome STS1 n=1 Tax=Malassezia yamatoensis TaxID=253288 RepID=A0AAJ5YSZ5_9BASI|nr:hypothetical protein MYAM1_002635 [Malassezia yamatoensis]